jgi:hypothetical protein
MDKQLGRPSGYTNEFADDICDELAITTDGFEHIIRRRGLNPQTVWGWVNRHAYFMEKYLKARAAQTELLYDEIQQIADMPMTHNGKPVDDLIDPGVPLEGGVAFAESNRRKMMIDVRKFKLTKLQPKRFGNNTHETVDVNVRRTVNPDEFKQLMSALTNKLQAPKQGEYIEHEDA